MSINAVVIPVVMFPFAFYASRWMTGKMYITKVLLIEDWPHLDIILLV